MSLFVLEDPDAVFIHIPKTGGTSIRQGVWQRRYNGPHIELPKSAQGLFTFAFVRHPLDRFVSCWKMYSAGAKNDPRPGDWNGIVKARLRLEDLVDITLDESVSPLDRTTLNGRIRHHTIPQTHPTNLLHLAEFVGRFESIDRDFAFIRNKLSIAVDLPHMRKTAHQRYHQELPNAVIDKLASFYAEDLKRLNYSMQ